MSILDIPAQVWFLAAFAAVMALLADTAVRSWRSPERVADPSTMWARPAPVRAPAPLGPRLQNGSMTVPWPGMRYAWGPGGAYFEDHAPWTAFTRAEAVEPRPIVIVNDDGLSYWARVEGGEVEHEGASLDWSPIAEHKAAAAARLPLDDVDEWLAARLSDFDHTLAMIDSRPLVSLVRGGVYRTVDDELAAFVDGSQQLHAYRIMRIGQTGEYRMIDAARVEALRVAA